MFSSVMPRGGPLECSRGGLMGHPWALMGRALMGPPGPSWAGPVWAPLVPHGPLWALMGRALVASLRPCEPGPFGLHGPLRAGLLWASLDPYGPGPCWPPGPS